MNQAFDNEALHMFTRAGIKPTADDVRVLANDLTALADGELDQSYPDTALAYEAATILRSRIGGFSNLRSYVNVLLAQNARKQRKAVTRG